MKEKKMEKETKGAEKKKMKRQMKEKKMEK